MKRLPLLFVALLTLNACDNADETAANTPLVRPAKIAVATSRFSTPHKVFPGITEATRKSILAFRVSGQVIELPVHAAQVVKEGDLIARLDDTPYRNSLNEAKAAHDLAQTDLVRQKKLYDNHHVAKSKLDIAQSTFEAAEAALKRAQDNIGYTNLTAPYDGIISRVDVDAFQNVQANEPVIQFEGNKDIDVVFNIPESLFLRLNKSNTNDGKVKVRFDAMPERAFDAQYREHDTLPDATTRSFKVTVSMPRPEGLTVLPGMSVNVEVDLSQVFVEEGSVVLIPVEALFEVDGQTLVWTLDEEDTLHRTAVKALGIEGPMVKISEGLENGARVLAAGVSHVREGQKVRPQTKERGI